MRRPLLLPLTLLSLAILACNTLLPPKPPVDWDTSATAVVLRADICCGMLYEPNGIPDVQVWGDGRIIWVETGPGPGRRVLTAQLTTIEIKTQLQAFVDAGFFGWRDSYEPAQPVYDAPSDCVSVTLKSASKTVCDMMGNPPAAFNTLQNGLTQGLNGTNFVPARGYLQATSAGAQTSGVPQWPAQALGVSLKDASGGLWIEGLALEAAWQAVNSSPLQAAASENGTLYNLVLMVPGVTRNQPPGP